MSDDKDSDKYLRKELHSESERAETMRHEYAAQHSKDPYYKDSKKNK